MVLLHTTWLASRCLVFWLFLKKLKEKNHGNVCTARN
ncbi:hypothetical protein [Citrobacter phage Tr1]|nr:hypothetical protein [Citrobacter phage Tr1]